MLQVFFVTSIKSQDFIEEQIKGSICQCVERINIKIHSIQEIEILISQCFTSEILSNEGKEYFGYSEQDISQNIVRNNIDLWQQDLIKEMVSCQIFKSIYTKIGILKYDTNIYKGDGVIEDLDNKYIYIRNDFGLDSFSIVDYKVIEFYDHGKMKKNKGKRAFFEYKKERFLDGRKQNNIQSLNVYSEYEPIYQISDSHQLVAEKLDEIHCNDTSIYEYNVIKKYTSKINLDERVKVLLTSTGSGYRVDFLQAKNFHNLLSKTLPVYTQSKYFLTLTIDSLANLLVIEDHFNNDRKMSGLSKNRFLERKCEKKYFSIQSLPILALQYYCSLDPYYYLLSSIDGSGINEKDSLKYVRRCKDYNTIMSQIGGCKFDDAYHLEVKIDEDQRKKAVLYNLDSISFTSKYPFYSKKFVVERDDTSKSWIIRALVKNEINGTWDIANYEYILEKTSNSDSLVITVYTKYIYKSKIATYSFNYKSRILSENLNVSIKPSFPKFKNRKLQISNTYELQEEQLEMRILAMVGSIAEWNEYCQLSLPISADNIDTDFNQYLKDKSLEDIFKDLNIFNNLKRQI